MSDQFDRKHVFISHIHEDDGLLGKLKDLAAGAGLDVRDSSIHSGRPNRAESPEYIKSQILAPQIKWASVLVVLVSAQTHKSAWVNWEIEYAAKAGKRVVGVFAHGAKDADLPPAFLEYGDALVGWQSERIVAALLGEFNEREMPAGDALAPPAWEMKHHKC